MPKALVCGAGGFIGNHLVSDLVNRGYYVIAVDRKLPEFSQSLAQEFHVLDLTDPNQCRRVVHVGVDEVYQLAADMGGAGYVFSGTNDCDIMMNSAAINLNVLRLVLDKHIPRLFYSSSACIYPAHNQMNSLTPDLRESSAYPAAPDSEYGWEKLLGERLYLNAAKNYGLQVRIARFHNVFGPRGTWQGGREKSPAALCRKIAQASQGGEIEVWGSGSQTRSFLYIDECIEGIHRLMSSSYDQPLNIGSSRMISIRDLALTIAELAGKNITIRNIPGPLGVQGRVSDNTLIQEVLGWQPPDNLEQGLKITYDWILEQIRNGNQTQ